ncbi:MAG: histidine phosphatase family protein [Pseudobutyrivibrio sp.]|nr:histidine phosphatase family protein [Pseudobutyrivibrio sp.]
MELTLIRHGKTKANLEHRYCGVTDESLCSKGIMEIEKAAAEGRFNNCDALFVSPKLRCRQTAEIIYPDTVQGEIEELQEIDFGIFEGKTYQELSGTKDYQDWIKSGGTLAFPEGESRDAFIERVLEGFGKLVDAVSKLTGKENKRISAVVHGGTIMALCFGLNGGDYFDYQVNCGEGYKLILDDNGKLIKEPERIC